MKPSFLLSYEETRWRIGYINDDDFAIREIKRESSGENDSSFSELSTVLEELGYSDQGIYLALDSSMVMAGVINTTDLPRKNRRSAMVYRLEEQLPCEAEKLTTDFIPNPSGQCLGLAVETDKISPIIDSLEEVGIPVFGVYPLALLALQGASNCENASDAKYVILADGDKIEIFRLANKLPLSWFSVNADSRELAECLHALMLLDSSGGTQPVIKITGNLDNKIATETTTATGAGFESLSEDDPITLAAKTANGLTSGKSAGWVDFRRDSLAQPDPWQKFAGLLKSACIMGFLLMLMLIGGMYWRSMQYEKITLDNERKMADEYAMLFPGRRIPANIKITLNSEFRKMSGMQGADSGTPLIGSALDILKQILAALPPEMRLRLLDIRIGSSNIFIDGQVRDHSAAETIAQSLSRAGLDMDPPRTENIKDGGVGFTLAGKPKAKENKTGSTIAGRGK